MYKSVRLGRIVLHIYFNFGPAVVSPTRRQARSPQIAKALAQFFRRVGSLQLIALGMLLVGLRLLLTGATPTPLVFDIKWQLLGQRVAEGDWLYRDIYDDTGVLAGLTYGLIHLLVGKSVLAYHLLATALVGLQMYFFDYLVRREGLLLERNHLPGLLFLVFSHLFVDSLTLSPVLLALTLLLAALPGIFRHIRTGVRDDELLAIGFYVGLAGLCYLPAVLFITLPLLAFLFYSSTNFRQHGLLLFGFILPFAICALVYLWFDAADAFFRYAMWETLTLPYRYLIRRELLLLVLVTPALALILSLFTLQNTRYTNLQSIAQQLMFFWVGLAVLAVFLDYQRAVYPLLLFVPPLAFLGAHFFTNSARFWQRESAMAVLWIGVIGTFLASQQNQLFPEANLAQQPLVLQPHPWADLTRQRRILVLGDQFSPYQESELATPFLSWDYARRDFADTDTYASVRCLYQEWERDPPEVVIDPEGWAARLFERVPALRAQYAPVGTDAYVRRPQMR